jgi:beta-N-acetylhexosaminidase
MFRFLGSEFTPDDRKAFNTIRPGGVLFFGDNLTSRHQIRALTQQLQAAAREEGLPPLFIAADQEGGIVTRLPADMVTVPSAMGLGALPAETIRESARINARQLREVGINTNYAPTADINSNPLNPVIRTRSFGETAETVSEAVLATMAGHIDESVIPTLKHFPGHGDTHVDSHHGLPEIETSIDELHQVELAPFVAAIQAGAPAIMTAHILFPALDDLPATLSKRILTGLLREELGFDGLIVTDSMSMDAIAAGWGLEEAAILAKEAGADVLESSEGPDAMVARHAALVKAVETGRLDEQHFRATAIRLENLRQQFNIGENPPDYSDSNAVRKAAREIAKHTLRTASGAVVPVVPDDESTVIIAFARLRNLEVVDRFDLPSVMEQAMATHLPNARMITISSDPTEDEIERALAAAGAAQTLVVATRDAIQHPYQQVSGTRLMEAASQAARRIHVNLRGPYDVGLLGDVEETVFTYGDAVVSLQALASALAG